MKTIYKILIIATIILFVGILVAVSWFAWDRIIYPSYLSVVVGCGDMNETELNDEGYYVAGRFNESSQEIILYDVDPAVLEHEQCHQKQLDQGRLYGCNFKIGKFINEIECKLVEVF